MNMDTTQCFPISDHVSFPRVSFLCLTVAHEKTHEYGYNSMFSHFRPRASFPRVSFLHIFFIRERPEKFFSPSPYLLRISTKIQACADTSVCCPHGLKTLTATSLARLQSQSGPMDCSSINAAPVSRLTQNLNRILQTLHFMFSRTVE